MDTLIEVHNRLIDQLGTPHPRSIEKSIDWTDRLIAIRGARGVGKTTLLLKHIREEHPITGECLYASLDNLYFSVHTVVELADIFYKKGGRYLFLDEVHKYPDWSRQIKNIYDSYPELYIVFTGSSVLDILKGQADLSRRAAIYEMSGLSFREFLEIESGKQFRPYAINEIIQEHEALARAVVSQIQPLAYFDCYLRVGYYPFYLETAASYRQRLQSVTNLVLEVDLPQCMNVESRSIARLKKLLYMIAISAPMKPNISKLSAAVEVSRQTISTYLDYLQHAALINLVRSAKRGHGQLTKPEKVLLHNTNLAYALAKEQWHPGSVRETFFVNQVADHHTLQVPRRGDFLVDDTWIFEVGGRNKDTSQITGLANAYIAADDIETGNSHKIPLWLFGFLA